MLTLSKRIKNMSPSATLQLTAKVAELRKQGKNIISFNVGEPDFNTPNNINLAAKDAIDKGYTKYTAAQGIVELREAICKKLFDDNEVKYSPSQISVGTGAKQSLANAILTICDTNDEVILPTPCWVSYIDLIKLAEAKPILVESKENDGFQPDISAIEKAITKNTKAILLNTPNNPTGAVYTYEILNKIGELAIKHDFYIISDEVYEKLVYNDKKHICVSSISKEIYERTIVINGFSKAYSMTGWRIGYAAGPIDIINGINSIQSHMTSNACSITQYAALEGLLGPQDTIESMRNEYDKRRAYLLERLNKIPGISCQNADGAFYLMPNISHFYGKSFNGNIIKNSFDISEYLLEEANIAVVPGDAFEAPMNIRLSYSNSLINIQEGIDRMEKALSKLQ